MSFFRSAVFSNEDGTTCVTDLQPVTIEFRDLFQHLPKTLLEKVAFLCACVMRMILILDVVMREYVLRAGSQPCSLL